MKVEWSAPKVILLFLGLISKAFATSPPLPMYYGEQLKAIGSLAWIAFDGMFVYLLKPPVQADKNEENNENH